MIGLCNLFEKTNPLHCKAVSPADMKYSFKMFYLVLDHRLSFKMNSEPLHPSQNQSLCLRQRKWNGNSAVNHESNISIFCFICNKMYFAQNLSWTNIGLINDYVAYAYVIRVFLAAWSFSRGKPRLDSKYHRFHSIGLGVLETVMVHAVWLIRDTQ